MGGAAGGNGYALLLSRAPGLVGSLALAAAAKVEVVGTCGRDRSAGVGGRAPGKSGLHSQAVSAVVGGLAAAGNLYAGLVGGAPGVAGSTADAVSALVMIVRAVSGNAVTG